MELEGCVWIVLKIPAFSRLVVGVPDQSALIDFFDEHHTSGRTSVRSDSGERHSVRLGYPGFLGLDEPPLEQRQRSGCRLILTQMALFVAFTQIGQSLHGVHLSPAAVGDGSRTIAPAQTMG